MKDANDIIHAALDSGGHPGDVEPFLAAYAATEGMTTEELLAAEAELERRLGERS